ncbi:dehydrogenase/reductase SDR family member on chromosome X homolog [Phlebotomus argentipes]|uniref:dehydrogenase/reductase SDR family member on chromosome X homolog n=1 Tax=Phlebotomus argentipes TaxID=94469 RepID=UPI00289351EE|nr:dehydrogenase/reductase SDR family member on chromosome X homolog [Phlebotomus argentipes]
MLFFLVVYVGPVVAAGVGLALLYFMKSSKEMPRNWDEFLTEAWFQYHGVRGLAEDRINSRYNVVELFKQPGRVAVMTGGNRGIGLKIVEKLLDCDMTVVLGVRNVESSRRSVAKEIPVDKTAGKLFFEQLDVGTMSSVRKFAAEIKKKYHKIHILINNAGIMAAPFALTDDGFESQMAINYIGHFLLTHLLLPEIVAAGEADQHSRIVNVSSCVHLMGDIDYENFHGAKSYYGATHYNQSKLAQILFTKHLQTLLDSRGAPCQVHAVHPGVVDTDLFVHSSSTVIPWFKKALFKNPEQGSRTVVFAAISPKLEGKGGSYLSNCRLHRTHAMAKDKAACQKLFDYTREMLKIEDFGRPQGH